MSATACGRRVPELVGPEIAGFERLRDIAKVVAEEATEPNLEWRFCSMAKLVFGMNPSLDGYVDHQEMRTGPALFRHWVEHVRDLAY